MTEKANIILHSVTCLSIPTTSRQPSTRRPLTGHILLSLWQISCCREGEVTWTIAWYTLRWAPEGRHLTAFQFQSALYEFLRSLQLSSRLNGNKELSGLCPKWVLPQVLSANLLDDILAYQSCIRLTLQRRRSNFSLYLSTLLPISLSSSAHPSQVQHGQYIPCFAVTPSSTYSAEPNKVDIVRALSLLHSDGSDKLPSVAYWAVNGTWPGSLPALRVNNYISPNTFRICQFLHFAAPCIALHINDNLAYGIIDSGSKALLISKPYLDQICPTAEVSTYQGRPFRQADSSPLPILGECSCSLQIGTIESMETFIIFEAPPLHKECLIGFEYLRSKNVFIGPDGLYIFPPSVLRPSSVQQDFPRSQLGQGAPVQTNSPRIQQG